MDVYVTDEESLAEKEYRKFPVETKTEDQYDRKSRKRSQEKLSRGLPIKRGKETHPENRCWLAEKIDY